MGKASLLTGEPRVGKTTALKRVLESVGMSNCGGFVTEALLGSTGEIYGYTLVTLDGQNNILAHIGLNSPYKISKYGVTLNALETIGVPAINNALALKQFVVIDEIGPMQMLSARFQQSVLAVLKSDVPLIGTVSLDNTWISELCEYAEIEIYPLTKGNRDEVPHVLVNALQRVA
jgi:nucleoside-triphosphatase